MSQSYKRDFGWAPADNSEQRAGELREQYGLQPTFFTGQTTGSERAEYWYNAGVQQNLGLHTNFMAVSHNSLLPTTGIESPTTVKHRRTRSGCFTCRQRRVKCDETRPICERCRKGNRQCDFPQPSTSSKRTVKESASGSERKESIAEQTASEDATTEDEDEDAGSASGSISAVKKGSAESPPRSVAIRSGKTPLKSALSSTDTAKLRPSLDSVSDGASTQKAQTSPASTKFREASRPIWTTRPDLALKWASLDRSLQECLIFQQENMTYHHYFLAYDFTNFTHEEFIERALSFDPLLYAAIAFAAYHRTIQEADGQFTSFWKFYSKSIVLLRQYLATNAERNEQILLTILQLAMFEEYLGDWTNMSTHLRAAQSIWTTLYTLETAYQGDVTQKIFHWISRISLTSSMVTNTIGTFEKQWFADILRIDQFRHEADRTNANNAIIYLNSKIRLQAFYLADLLARADQVRISAEEFSEISNSLDALQRELQSLHDPTCVVEESRIEQSAMRNASFLPSSERIPVYRAHLWPLTHLWASWLSLKQVLISLAIKTEHATGELSEGDVVAGDLERLALAQFQIFDTIHGWLDAPAGAEFCCHVPTSFAALFLKRTPENMNWARRTLAMIEQMGYTCIPSLRRTLAGVWQMPDLVDWWLPNGEGKTRLLQEIRGVVEERNREKIARGSDEEHGLIYDTGIITGKLGIEP